MYFVSRTQLLAMKNLLKIFFLMSFIFCQLPSKAEFFLSDLKRLDKLDEKTSTQIKKELNKIEIKIKKELKFSYKIEKTQEQVSERRITGYKFPSKRANDAYLSALLSMNNPTQYEADYLERQFQVPVYETVNISPRIETIENKILPMDINTFSTTPKWEDVVEFYGGYSELASKNINKADWQNGKFMIDAKLTGIELISETECLAIVDISGDLKLNKVPKHTYKYKGNYAVEDFDIYDIYRKRSPDIVFTFKDKKYMGTSNKFTKPINSFVDVVTELLNRYSFSIDMMFDDLISDEVYNNIDEIKNIIGNIEKKRIAEAKREEELRIAEAKREEEKEKIRRRDAPSIFFSIGKTTFTNMSSNFIHSSSLIGGISFLGERVKYDYKFSYTPVEIQSPFNMKEVTINSKNAIHHAAHNFSLGYSLLHYFPLRPFIGLGYQNSGIEIYDGDELISNSITSGFYYFVEVVTKNFESTNMFIGLSYSASMKNDIKKWNSTSLKIGTYL
jgi:hypothetical protein